VGLAEADRRLNRRDRHRLARRSHLAGLYRRRAHPRTAPEVAHGAYAGLLGRGRRERDPGSRLERLAALSAEQLLTDAALRLGGPCTREERFGRVEREVVAAAEGAELLVLARDGDRTHLGPRSLGPASRFVVDHAPCPVLLVWPEAVPSVATIPPPPPHPPRS
jgi:nucleotide-binding universal stress UspA family protein